jgi:hypothetical protein
MGLCAPLASMSGLGALSEAREPIRQRRPRKHYVVASVEISRRVAKQRVPRRQTKDHCTGFAQEGYLPVN